MNDSASPARWEFADVRQWSLAVGVVALGACLVGAMFNPAQFLRAYLTAYLFYLGIGLGAMVLLMIYQMTGGSWGYVIRRILEASMKTLPLLALLFLPIAFGLRYLYPWAQREAVAASPELQYQQFYLAPRYFCIREAVYFALWLMLALLMSSWLRKAEQAEGSRWPRRLRTLGGIGALIYGITLHFAAVDWAMSLTPAFHSTIWGPLFALGQLLSALSLAIIVYAMLVSRPPLSEIVSPKVLNDLGSLLLTLLILWAYLAWFQYMLIWIANLRTEVVWYLARTGGFWLTAIWAIVLLHFTVPFFLLLLRVVKRNVAMLAGVAGLILFMQFVFMYYQIMPSFRVPAILGHWMDPLMPLAIGGFWLAYFLRQLQSQALLPANDFNRAAALQLRRLDEEEAAREEGLAYE